MSLLLRALRIIGWCFLGAAALEAAYVISGSPASGAHPTVEYKDFVSILLTALGVMIALAAVAAALAAVWGFEFLRKEMHKIAAETAADVAKKEVQAIVPGLVEETSAFAREAQRLPADAVAEEYGREVRDGE